jgi:hypothetical protein
MERERIGNFGCADSPREAQRKKGGGVAELVRGILIPVA